MQRAQAGTSTASEYWMGLPMSSVSSSASSSFAPRISSENFCSIFLRAAGALAAQRPSSNAARAERTAVSTSAARPRAIGPSRRLSIGECLAKVSPVCVARRSPSTSMRPSIFSAVARSAQFGAVVVLIGISWERRSGQLMAGPMRWTAAVVAAFARW